MVKVDRNQSARQSHALRAALTQTFEDPRKRIGLYYAGGAWNQLNIQDGDDRVQRAVVRVLQKEEAEPGYVKPEKVADLLGTAASRIKIDDARSGQRRMSHEVSFDGEAERLGGADYVPTQRRGADPARISELYTRAAAINSAVEAVLADKPKRRWVNEFLIEQVIPKGGISYADAAVALKLTESAVKSAVSQLRVRLRAHPALREAYEES